MEKIIEIVRLKQITTEIELPITEIRSSFEIANWLQEEIGNETQELLVLLCLDTKNKINAFSFVFKGTVNQATAHPRDIFQRAILANSARIIVAHNHPSNTTKPSEADKSFTKRLAECGDILGIQLLDHLIIGHK